MRIFMLGMAAVWLAQAGPSGCVQTAQTLNPVQQLAAPGMPMVTSPVGEWSWMNPQGSVVWLYADGTAAHMVDGKPPGYGHWVAEDTTGGIDIMWGGHAAFHDHWQLSADGMTMTGFNQYIQLPPVHRLTQITQTSPVGLWRWYSPSGSSVYIHSDGSVVETIGGVYGKVINAGRWSNEEMEGRIEIDWKSGAIDEWDLSDDGQEMTLGGAQWNPPTVTRLPTPAWPAP
jgi:hypothetical protein